MTPSHATVSCPLELILAAISITVSLRIDGCKDSVEVHYRHRLTTTINMAVAPMDKMLGPAEPDGESQS